MMNNRPSYEDLLLENEKLRGEIKSLREQLGLPTPKLTTELLQQMEISLSPKEPIVNRGSTTDEKIDFFLSMFVARTDVYARRYVSRKTQKAGYTPVCGNEWAKGICEKPKIKCAKCPSRNLLPLTRDVIYRHLRGKDPLGEDVVGVYPMLPDETCLFIVADFDDGNWREDVQSLREVCRDNDIDAAVERSRSGNGGHVWLFFAEPLACSIARKLASVMITLAMERRHDLGFKSYDRLLPNQDTLPSGGFGNLIALPFQGLAAKSNNSLFLDDDFAAYEDQWAYLSTIEKIAPTQAETLIEALGGAGELGVLANSEDKPDKPWEKKPTIAPLMRTDFPERIQITRANGLYIPKSGCSERALNRIKRLAAFKNPEFYKAQAIKLSTFGKERIVCRAEETEEYIHLPRGLEPELIALVDSAGTRYCEISDETQYGRTLNISFAGELRDEQRQAVEALLEHSNGVLSATTAFGKTVVAAYLIAQRKVNTLILVHTQALMNQWKASLERFLIIDEALPEQPKGRGRKKQLSQIGCLGGGKETAIGMIDVAIIGSMFEDGDVKQFVKDYGMVIADECHHVSSNRFEDVMSAANARYVYGLTATPTRQDGRHPIIFQQCGPIRYRVDAKEQAIARGFSHSLIPRFTRFRKPLSFGDEVWPIQNIYNDMTGNKPRNDLILRDIDMAFGRGRIPLILTERVPHAKMLAEQIKGQNRDVEVFLLIGQGTAKDKKELLEALRNVPAGKQFVIVATGKYVGEGFDEPRLDTLFITMPIAWKGTVTQYAGRLHRICAGKEEVIVYDYVDIQVPVLERMYHKRLAVYASLGYSAQASPVEGNIRIGAIHNQQSFFAVFAQDVEHAQKEILIVSPYLSKSRVMQMKKLFLTAMLNGARVAVITRPAEAFSPDSQSKVAALIGELENGGIKVVLKDNIHQKFCVIDYRIVWYGSINFLSYGKSEESIMRFENEEIAGELLEGLD